MVTRVRADVVDVAMKQVLRGEAFIIDVLIITIYYGGRD